MSTIRNLLCEEVGPCATGVKMVESSNDVQGAAAGSKTLSFE